MLIFSLNTINIERKWMENFFEWEMALRIKKWFDFSFRGKIEKGKE